jgi:hypothetical protein
MASEVLIYQVRKDLPEQDTLHHVSRKQREKMSAVEVFFTPTLLPLFLQAGPAAYSTVPPTFWAVLSPLVHPL